LANNLAIADRPGLTPWPVGLIAYLTTLLAASAAFFIDPHSPSVDWREEVALMALTRTKWGETKLFI